ncbi:PhzF family phenazine biosynthesis protein [Kangiella sediminilitoris]|uniref:PhzF family phenazine biosynthesis protein n=1 Tax=Kangiella sediminilitoris TaxID=1144748 RepID=UPI001471145F|nr:PhzF family phenazine biosynthesis protein [Kangiella sediminilitoris]
MSKRYSVSVFAAENLLGTTAVVYVLTEPLEVRQMQALAQEERAPATCFLQLNDNNSINVRFFNTSHEILLCGHGLLACARVLTDYGFHSMTIKTVSDKVQVEVQSDSSVWVKFSELVAEPDLAPDWIATCLSVPPADVSRAGPSNGYWVMEWPADFDLSSLVINSDVLKSSTQRALIATQKSNRNKLDYCFRYFAPQHGVTEDKATGSANRVLTSYWSKKLGKPEVNALQLSPGGAFLKGRFEHGAVWISGNVFIDG